MATTRGAIGGPAEALLQRLEWTVLRRLDGLLQGDYRTLMRGGGVDLPDLREYQYGDDVRHIHVRGCKQSCNGEPWAGVFMFGRGIHRDQAGRVAGAAYTKVATKAGVGRGRVELDGPIGQYRGKPGFKLSASMHGFSAMLV